MTRLAGLGFALLLFSSAAPAAQAVADTTLGAESSVVLDLGSGIEFITGGAPRNTTVLHSLEQLVVLTGGQVWFDDPAVVENIVCRVTGPLGTVVDGSLGTWDSSSSGVGNANLFILNPNGFLFGPNASLFVGGSFTATTADAFTWEDGATFSVSGARPPPLLTVSLPTGLRFRESPQPILCGAWDGGGLHVPDGENILFAGGDVYVERGALSAPGGRIDLAAAAGPGEVTWQDDGLALPDDLPRGTVRVANGSLLNVQYHDAAEHAGAIGIQGKDVELLGGENGPSVLWGGISGDGGTTGARAGPIAIDATGTTRVEGESNIVSDVHFFGDERGDAGHIRITTSRLEMGRSVISSSANNWGHAGDITITAREGIFLDGRETTPRLQAAAIFSSVGATGVGNAGTITIKAPQFAIDGPAIISTDTFGRGDAGDIRIQVTEHMRLTGSAFLSSILSDVKPGGIGSAGDIDITAGSLTVNEGFQISSRTLGTGDAGRIRLTVRGDFLFQGSTDAARVPSSIGTTVETGAVGHGGPVEITAGALHMENIAQLQAATRGTGDAGSIDIDVQGPMTMTGSNTGDNCGIFTSVLSFGEGQGGAIDISCSSLVMTRGAQIASATVGQGDAGPISIQTGSLFMDSHGGEYGTGLFASAIETAIGNAGDIDVQTAGLAMHNGSRITVSARGRGAAGDVRVRADEITLKSGSSIKADTVGGEGNIELAAEDLLLRGASTITTNATGAATGGNITLNTGNLVALENSDISANAEEAFGGRIRIDTTGLFGTTYRDAATEESDITATSALGPQFSGTVEIRTPAIDPRAALVTLPAGLFDPSRLVPQTRCPYVDGSSYTTTGRTGLPASPNQVQSGALPEVDLVAPAAGTATTPAAPSHLSTRPEPARRWRADGAGRLVLMP